MATKNSQPKSFNAWAVYDEDGRPMGIHLNRAEARDMKGDGEKVLRVHVSVKK